MEHRADESLHRGPLYRNAPAGRNPEGAEQEQDDPSEDKPPSDVTAKAFKAVLDGENYQKRWVSLLQMVYEDYPYSTMYGVHIVDGAIVSCEMIQRSMVFGQVPSPVNLPLTSLFDAKWQALEALCLSIGSGRLEELSFNNGRPVVARTAEGGRRFKSFLRKHEGK